MRYMDLFSGIGGFALGFPDGWTEYGADGRKMSDSARYKALGNAVTVNFPRMIGEKIKPR